MGSYDFAIVGGGIVGLSAAMALGEKFPRARIVVLEKESKWAEHQTGNNSGVIHSGIYYKPGSLKATLAREGNRSVVDFCRQHGIEHEVCGKVIVATEPNEMPLLKNLHARGLANGLSVREIGRDELHEIEPHASGLAALHVPSTGIVNYRRVAETFAWLVQERGGELRLNAKVETIARNGAGTVIETASGTVHTQFLINCAGLYSDRVAKLDGVKTGMKIVPFRGEYYELKPEKRYLVKHLIYPVPNPNFPFLGVHFTRMIAGGVHAGPNAVLGLKREGYRKSDFSPRDLADVMIYPAFWKFAGQNWREGIREMIRSWSKRAFVRSLQKLIPEIQADDLVPSRAGVRAQALMRDGRLMDDFVLIPGDKSIHVCNVPSPAATASIEIGKAIVKQISL
ncbi:MAG: hydroxyglutarate oxidase [Cyanobacteria bacterium 13_1_40CM_2_61_4]|nr:MAG: hydroxyglutarate oxidase [Cyanobacteria bacterium 13_1_40CM_2_61_4]